METDGSESEPHRQLFAKLVMDHLDGLYRTALRMTGNHAAAEDIVQETCLRAFAGFSRYERNTNFKAWLFQILANLCIDRFRRQASRVVVPIETLPTDVETLIAGGDVQETPEVHAMRCDQQQAIIDAVAALDPEPRAIVLMILVEGMSYNETAESMDMPTGTVRSKLHRARRQLRETLDMSRDNEAAPSGSAGTSPKTSRIP